MAAIRLDKPPDLPAMSAFYKFRIQSSKTDYLLQQACRQFCKRLQRQPLQSLSDIF